MRLEDNERENDIQNSHPHGFTAVILFLQLNTSKKNLF